MEGRNGDKDYKKTLNLWQLAPIIKKVPNRHL